MRVGETTVEGTATACEFIEDTGALWVTVEVPDDAPWLDVIRP